MQVWSTSLCIIYFMTIKNIKIINWLTFEPLELCLAYVLTHCGEELVHLLEGQRVVQCLQWIDGGHQGATFKPCTNTWSKTQTHLVAAIITDTPWTQIKLLYGVWSQPLVTHKHCMANQTPFHQWVKYQRWNNSTMMQQESQCSMLAWHIFTIDLMKMNKF